MRPLLLLFLCLKLWAQNCAPAVPLAPNDAQSAVLNSTSCQLSDGSWYSDYVMTFPVRGTLTLTAKGSSGLGLSIIIRNANGNRLNPPGGATVARYMESGTYNVLVNGSASGPSGTFSLTSVFAPEAGVLCTQMRNLGTIQPVAGRLSAASCRLLDGSAYDFWQVTVYGAGTLNLSLNSSDFQTYLILRGPDGSALASDPGNISLLLAGNETYTVIASALNSSQKPGAYQLAASFVPVDGETCISQGAFVSNAPASGSVSSGSCNFDLPGREDSSLFNFYDLHVDAAGTAQLQVTSSSFSPLLLLLDADGNEVVEDSQSAGSGMPLIQQQLSPGDYRLLIFNEDSFDGQYTMQYNFTTGSAPACQTQQLADGLAVAGALSGATSCRVRGSMGDIYQVVLPSSGTLGINMSSGDFTTFLVLRDSKDNVIDYGEQTPDGSSSNASVNLAAGTYSVAALSADLPGNYQILAQFTPQALTPCGPPQSMLTNTGFTGNLSPGTCVGTDGQPVDYYQFTTAADGTVAASMTSNEISTLLTLTDAKDNELRMDAGSYSEGNSILVQYLKAGTYRLQARSDEYNTAGPYRLSVQFAPEASKPNYCAAAAVRIGTPANATLGNASCQYPDGTFADFYKFAVSDGTKPVIIAGSSTAFDTYLILLDAKGNILASDDNSGGGTNAQISCAFEPGAYYVVIKPAADPTMAGGYTLSIKQ